MRVPPTPRMLVQLPLARLPLALLAAACAADVAGRITKRRRWMNVGRTLMPIGALCSMVTTNAGRAEGALPSGQARGLSSTDRALNAGLASMVGLLALSRMQDEQARPGYLLLSAATVAGLGYSAWRRGRIAGPSGAGVDASSGAARERVPEHRSEQAGLAVRAAVEPVSTSAVTGANATAGPTATAPGQRQGEHVSSPSRLLQVPNSREDVTRVTLFGQLDDGSYAAEIMNEGEVPYVRYWRNAIDQLVVYMVPEREALDAILAALAEGRIDFTALQQYGGTKGGFSSIAI